MFLLALFIAFLVLVSAAQWDNLPESLKNREMGSYGLFAERAPYIIAPDTVDGGSDIRDFELQEDDAAKSIASFIDQTVKVFLNLTIQPKRIHKQYMKMLDQLIPDASHKVRVKHYSLDFILHPQKYELPSKDAEDLADNVPRHSSDLFSDGLFFRKMFDISQTKKKKPGVDGLIKEIIDRRNSFQISLLLSYLVHLPISLESIAMVLGLIKSCGEWKPHWLDPNLPTFLRGIIMEHLSNKASEAEISEWYGDLWIPTVALMAQVEPPKSVIYYDESRVHSIGKVHTEAIRFPHLLTYLGQHPLCAYDGGKQEFLRAISKNDSSYVKILVKNSAFAHANEIYYRVSERKLGTADFSAYLKRTELDEEIKTATHMLRAAHMEISTLMTSSAYVLNYATKPSGPSIIFPHNFALLTGAADMQSIFSDIDPVGKLLKTAPNFPAVYGKLVKQHVYIGTSMPLGATVLRLRPHSQGFNIHRLGISPAKKASESKATETTTTMTISADSQEADGELKQSNRRQFSGVSRLDVCSQDILIVTFGKMDLPYETLVTGWFGSGRELLVNLTTKVMDSGHVDALVLLVEDVSNKQ